MTLFKLLFVTLMLTVPLEAKSAPDVVVTIRPLHSLVAGVMEGVGEPYLLLSGRQSVHHLTLKPSQVKAIHNADLLIWIGPIFENYLNKIVQYSNVSTLMLMDVEDMVLLPLQAESMEVDGHIWLDPMNAIRIVEAVAARLIVSDPENGGVYRENRKNLVQRLVHLDATLASIVKPAQDILYLTYHDSLRYFENRYGLRSELVTRHPEQPLSVKRVLQVKGIIAANGINCLFYGPDIQPERLAVFQEGLPVIGYAIDPVGFGVKAGPNGYFTIMGRIAQSFEQCLFDQR